MRVLLSEGFDRRYVLIPLLAAIAFVVVAYFVTESRRATAREITQAINVEQDRVREVAELIEASLEAESAQRGFVITGEHQYLEPYEAGRNVATQLIADLQMRYKAADSAELQVIQSVATDLDGKFAEMNQTIDLVRKDRRSEAIAVVKSEFGLHRMQDIRKALDDLRMRERARINQGLVDWRAAVRTNSQINALMTVFTLLLLIACGLLATREIGRRRKAALALQQLVEERTTELQELSQHMLEMGEVEKASLARELHDELGGLLVAIRMDIAQIRRKVQFTDEDIVKRFARIDAALASGIELKRRVIEELRPTLLDNMGLMAALRWQASQVGDQARIKVVWDAPEDAPELGSEAPIAVFRTVQEALSNVARHSRAKTVWLKASITGMDFQLSVEDDGEGLPPGSQSRAGSHGLKQMQFRIDAVGGRISIGTRQPHGTSIKLTVPIVRTGVEPAD